MPMVRPTIRRIRRTEDGSVLLVMLVGFIATGLVVALLFATQSNLKLSRRNGDSSNALQLADAGVNDAVRAAGSAAGVSLGPINVTVPGAGTYTYSGQRDPNSPDLPVWHLLAYGTDTSGVQRKVRADALAEPLFTNALYATSNLFVAAGGTVDSFQDGSSQANMCTGLGTIGTNDAAHLTFGNHGSVGNCQNSLSGNWPYPVDGCVSYATPPPDPVLATSQNGWCPPPPNDKTATPAFIPPSVTMPLNPTINDNGQNGNPSSYTCSNTLAGGTVIEANSIIIAPGCAIDTSSPGPITFYTTGSVTVGNGSGNNGNVGPVNPPPSGSGPCNTVYTGKDSYNNSASYYCPGYASLFRVYSSGPSVTFGNHSLFWGVIVAPNAALAVNSGQGNCAGNPQAQQWGATIVGAGSSCAQLSIHYDQSLSTFESGQYQIANWREEPLP